MYMPCRGRLREFVGVSLRKCEGNFEKKKIVHRPRRWRNFLCMYILFFVCIVFCIYIVFCIHIVYRPRRRRKMAGATALTKKGNFESQRPWPCALSVGLFWLSVRSLLAMRKFKKSAKVTWCSFFGKASLSVREHILQSQRRWLGAVSLERRHFSEYVPVFLWKGVTFVTFDFSECVPVFLCGHSTCMYDVNTVHVYMM